MTKTHFKKLKNPNYLGSWDLADSEGKFNPITVTMQTVSKEQVHDGQGGQEECVVLRIAGMKPMILNSTNLKAISKLYGPFIEDWAGKRITIEAKRIKAFGDTHDALRVSTTAPTKPKLTPHSPEWAKAFEAVKSKTASLTQIKSKYDLSPDDERTLAAL